MSYRYRTIYREQAKCDPTGEKVTLWGAAFSPCQPDTSSTLIASSSGYCHLLVASSVGSVLCYHLQDKNDSADISTLTQTNTLNAHGDSTVLGCAAVSAIENDVGESVVASITLNGDVRLYHHQRLPSSKEASIMRFIADSFFTVANATGNNVSICPCQNEGEVIVAVGCIDGSTKMFHTGLTLGAKKKGTAMRQAVPPGTLLETMGQGNSCVMSIAWSPKGELLAVGRKDGIVDVFSSPVSVGAFNREGSSSSSSGIHCRLHRMVAHSSFVRAVSFSPDGALLLTGGDDGRVHAYDIMRRKVALVGSFVGHKSWILGITWHPDASRFATCSADKTVKLWEASTRQNVHTFDGHKDKVWGITFSPCGTRLASCGDDGIIQIYSCEKQ